MVTQLYQRLLQRDPDSVGMTAWSAKLDNGASVRDIALGIESSLEFRTDQLNSFYTNQLVRFPDPTGLAAFLPGLDQGDVAERTSALIFASPEYFTARSNESNAGFLSSLYRDALGRAPDQRGNDFFLAALDAGATRFDVALAVVASPEARLVELENYYERFLGRASDPAGKQAWLAAWQNGMGPMVIAANFLGSPEFAANVASGAANQSSGMIFSPAVIAPITHLCHLVDGGVVMGGCNVIDAPPVPGIDCSGNAGERTLSPAAAAAGFPQTSNQDGPAAGGGEIIQDAPGVYDAASSTGLFSAAGVRYSSGAINISATDLSSGGFGIPWGQTRSFQSQFNATDINGNHWIDDQMPLLLQSSTGNTITVVSSGENTRSFDQMGSNWVSHFYVQDKLIQSGNTFILTDTAGDQIHFIGFGTGTPSNEQGAFDSFVDRNGNTTSVISRTTDGKPTEVTRSTTVSGVTTTESYVYSYLGSGDANVGLLSNVTMRRKVGAGSYTTIRQVAYTYYDGTLTWGNLHDLQTASIEDAASNVLDTWYYRYYESGQPGGYAGGLKYVLNPQAFALMAHNLALNPINPPPLMASDATVANYAVDYFQYDSMMRVIQAQVQGTGCTSCSGVGTFNYSYLTSSNSPGMNSWQVKTVETLQDGVTNTVYTNSAGEVMLRDFTMPQHWDFFNEYDSQGRRILTAAPSAVFTFDEANADLLNNQGGVYQDLNNNSGLIQVFDYGMSTTATETVPGSVTGYLADVQLKQGQMGAAVKQLSLQYFNHTAGSTTISPLASSTVYRNTNSGAEMTSFSYTYFPSTVQVQSVTTTLPAIPVSENGPNQNDVSTTFFDTSGRPIWNKDADNFIQYIAYDPATGAVTETIQDVDTTKTGDFQNLPSGWTSPGELHILTAKQVDGLGRTTKLTDPIGNITYTVYIDTNYEMRVYPGWTGTTTTGPIQDYREDRGTAPGVVGAPYLESLTMSPTPHTTGGVPDGTEAISGLQTLSRQYINLGRQVLRADAYFNLSLTWSTAPYIGTQNTNFYTTVYGYDEHGNLNRTQNPTGTINRTVYDSLDRAVSKWVGTNDTTPDGQEWSPADNGAPSNMLQTVGYTYDGGGVGDSNLTQVTVMPGPTSTNRVTNNYFDWRDRLVATKSGVQATEDTTTHRPIIYYEYDNLSEVFAQSRFDGDGVTITSSNGVPVKPSPNLLRAYQTTNFDEQRRAYATHVFEVDQSTGNISATSLNTLVYRNHRGLVIDTSAPGGLVTKNQYDGSGRTTIQYSSDGGGDSNWGDALNVIGDLVANQVEYKYDAVGNVLLVTNRDGLSSDPNTGALTDPTHEPLARVSYTARYYDAANRLTDSVNVGTNGGTIYNRPGTVPARSDTVLVTSWAYNSAGWDDTVTDPRGIVTKTTFDALYRRTKVVQAWTGGSPGASSDVTTEYTYDGDGHMLIYQADLPGSAFQKTQYVYGVTTTGTNPSDINSNDLLAKVQYPDKTTGNPSTMVADQETYAYNTLGQSKTSTDRNGTTHTFTYDVLGRLTADAATTLGSLIDGAVRRQETAYDTGGRPFQYTSYNAVSGGTIVEQVQQVYSGLGQLITEYQAHGGAVNTSTTPKVQYAYTEMAGGANNSRLISLTYPNGRQISYGYDTIGRLTAITLSTNVSEADTYLGLNTVVQRTDNQTGIQLTYIKRTGEANGDGGDQFIGLDRFGRVVDQRWVVTSTGTAIERLQYGYDRDGNVLFQNNLVNTAFGELYHANGANGYDNLNRLTNFARGVLSASVMNGPLDTIASPSRTQAWTLDAVGNWSTVTTNGTPINRVVNKQNEITTLGGSGAPAYDNNGNTRSDPILGRSVVYDAWNRIVAEKNGSTIYVTYSYDALGRRVVENPSTAKDIYFSASWQVLEEDVAGAMQNQYVWHPMYTDALIERDTPSQRLYAVQNADWDVTALVDTTGTVQERYVYDPYGALTVLTPSWGSRASSLFSWIYLHQGGRLDTTSTFYNFRNRDYSTTLGRWLQVDPIHYSSSDSNLYGYLLESPEDAVDPNGLLKWPWGGSRLTPKDLMILGCNNKPYTPESFWGPGVCKACNGNPNNKCPGSLRELCDFIKKAYECHGKKPFDRIIIAGHCGGVDAAADRGPGVSLSKDGERFDGVSLSDPSAVSLCLRGAIIEATPPDGIVILCSCGHINELYLSIAQWEEKLQQMADALHRRVCACGGPANPDRFTGCNCPDGLMTCKDPSKTEGPILDK